MTHERQLQLESTLPITVSDEERNRAYRDWENVNRLVLITEGMYHAAAIRDHIDSGGSLAAFPPHQAHVDSLIVLRLAKYIADNKISVVGFPASSKLYPGGELHETAGRRAFAHSEVLGINLFEMVQQTDPDAKSVAAQLKNGRAFVSMRRILEQQGGFVCMYGEGTRGGGSGKLRQIHPGVELLFTKRRGEDERLADNNQVLGVPMYLGDTRNITIKGDKEGEEKINFVRVALPFRARIGQPFFARDILKDIQQFGLPSGNKKELAQSFADVVGARLASVMPVAERGEYNKQEFAKLVAFSEKRNRQQDKNTSR